MGNPVLAPTELADRLRAAGLRVTSQRLDVYEALASSGLHLAPDQILERVRGRHPSISANTVYQVLETLVAAGVIQRADIGAGPRRYDANVEPHHHLVCTSCGEQVDVACSEGRGACLEPEQSHGYAIHRAQVTFLGTCSRCTAPSPG